MFTSFSFEIHLIFSGIIIATEEQLKLKRNDLQELINFFWDVDERFNN